MNPTRVKLPRRKQPAMGRPLPRRVQIQLSRGALHPALTGLPSGGIEFIRGELH